MLWCDFVFAACTAQTEESHWRLSLFRRMRGLVFVNSKWSIDAISMVAKSFKQFEKLRVDFSKISVALENKIQFKSPRLTTIQPASCESFPESDQAHDLRAFLETHPQINSISIDSHCSSKLIANCKSLNHWSITSGIGIPHCFRGKLEAADVSHIHSLTLDTGLTCPIALLHPELVKLDLREHKVRYRSIEVIPKSSLIHLPKLRDLRLRHSSDV